MVLPHSSVQVEDIDDCNGICPFLFALCVEWNFGKGHSLIPIGRTKDKKTPRRHRGGGTVDETDLPRRVPQPSIHTRSPAKKPLAPNLELLVQQLCGKSSKLGTGDNPSTTGERSRGLFPFQSTRSGNLKIVPDQVVFESKKLSVLVADPHNATVNVKAEQARVAVPQLELPVSPRADSQRHELADSGDPFVMDKPQEPTTDVPLSSLGFTSERPIDWKNITLPEKTDLYKEIARRITTYKNADCVVRIGNDEFHCHLLVLQSYSAYFDDKNVKQMDLTGSSVTSRVFSIIYDWMLSPSRESCHLLKRDNILEVFIASQFLGIKELEEQCWAFIDNDELFREDTAFLLYLDARKVGNTAVMELMLPRIMKFFLLLVSTKDFLELAVQELCLLLRSNYISVNSEMEVLMSAVRWLMHDWDTRKQHLLEVMRCVRFGLIAPWQLVDVKRNPENPEFMELMSYPEIQKMVDDGLAFVIIKYWYGNQTEDYYHWIDLLGLTEPTNRNWAGEDKHYVTYREFLLYLEEYQRTNIAEFKDKKFGKPALGGPSKKEDVVAPQVPSARPRMSHTASNLRTLKQHTTDGNAASPCMMMPPEMLSQYLGSIGRSGSKSVSRSTNANRTRTER
ncbi:uncharacterized protein LOC106637731 [Copidosoma floridanum]|uniref:uncharacterized protein LOC106637731 n=1 Tax=Copidosoma floridanum TaxID=29053 RepID=UPI0006C9BAE2|nr:uncharacterized protein LOC106637731 [Copidosoma floridanum]